VADRVLSGTNFELENQADEILMADRRETGDKLDFLSAEQLVIRFEHEVYSVSGLPIDAANASGLYRRAHSGRTINDRPTGRNFSRRADPWLQDYHEFTGDDVAGAWLPVANRPEVTGGQSFEWGVTRDPRWPVDQGAYHHLDRFQRCRIRAALRLGGFMLDAQAHHYGVPVVVIERIRNGCQSHVVESC
jgi:hypothetical protein